MATTTSTVNIENLVNSGRSLTWIEPPTCRSCSLPFTANAADVLVKRVPFLLNCQHVLCEPCVLEFRTRNGVVCQQCHTETPLLNDEDSALSLQPSLYLLGVIQQSQYELLNLDQDTAPAKSDRKRSDTPERAIRELPPSELETVEQVQKLLKTAYHSYERNRKKLEICGHQQEENVSMVIEQVSGCFLKRHHLLQLAEQQMMSKIRGRYVSLRNQLDEAQKQLEQAHVQLKEYLKQMKKYQKKEPATDSRSKEAWLAFSAEVKKFLETAPLKLLDDIKQQGTPFVCNQVEESLFLRSMPSYGKMITERKECVELKLYPFTVQTKEKEKVKKKSSKQSPDRSSTHREKEKSVAESDKKGHKRSPDRSSTHSHQRAKEKSSSTDGRHTKDRKRSPDQAASHSNRREKEKTPPLKQQRERHHSGSSSKHKQKRKDKSPLKDNSETSSVATLPSSSSLPKQIPPKGDFVPHCKVVVTNVNSPHQIFVQRELFAQNSQMMAEMCSLDAEQYASECPEKPPEIVEGEMYLVQPVVPSSFSWHSKWYRARVLKAYPSQQYLVLYVDFGHKEQVPASKICPISKDLRAFDFCVQKVQLYGLEMVPPERAGVQNAKLAECCQVLIDLIAHRTLLMATLSATTKSTACVDLLVPEGCSTKQPPQSLRGALLYLGFCKPHSTTDPPAAVCQRHERWLQGRIKPYAKMLPSPKIAEVDTFPCTILHSTSPDSFQLMPSLWLKTKLEPLQQLLDVDGPNAPKVYDPFVGLVCAFRHDEDDGTVRWMRCRIERVGLAECDLKAIDSGRRYACVPWYNIRLLDPAADCYWMHPLALECRLVHITPKPTKTTGDGEEAQWSKEAIAEFNTLVGCQASDFEVTIERCESDHSYSVLLYLLNRSTKDTCINGLLVRNGHAVCCGPVTAVADRTKKVVEVIDPVPEPALTAHPSVKAEKERIKDPRIRVEVLSPICSPSEFYVRLQSWVPGLELLHNTIQQYMEQMLEEENEEPEVERAIGELCVAFTPSSPGSESEWYRACITGVADPYYQMLLIDTAQSVNVHRTNVARLPSRFAQLQPGAVRCRLGNVMPVGGNEQWHQSSIDSFKNAIATSPRHAISLDAANMKNAASELPVVLWALMEEEVAPLAPRRDRYININQSLINCGMAHCITRPGPASASPDKGDTGENPEAKLEEAISAIFRAKFEQMQQFFRTVDDVTRNQTASAPVRMGDIVGSATDSACDELLSLIDKQPIPISDWLPPSAPIEKSIFVGRPTFVADDGALYLHDECQEPLLTRMAERIRLHVETATAQQQGSRKMRFLVGDPCLARFHLDGLWYRGKVLEVNKKHYSVQFVDYGNVEQCNATDLWDETICTRIPVQAYRLRLAEIEPAGTKGWTRQAVETFHSLIVGKRCTVRIVNREGTAQDPAAPLCTLQTIRDENSCGVFVDEALLALDGLFVRQTSRKTNLSDRCYQQLMAPDTVSVHCSNRAARDIIALMNEVQEQFGRSPGAPVDGQSDDPYAWNDEVQDDTSGDVANRAQIFNLFSPSSDHHSSASSSDADCEAVAHSLLSTPLPSPATFDSNELEASSRLCSVERVLEHEENDNDEPIEPDVEYLRGGAISFSGFRIMQLSPSQTGFYASCTNYSDALTLHIYPHLEGHRMRCDQMAKKIQEYARSTNKMRQWQATMLEPGSPCLALYAEDGLYYRALIEGWDEEERTARVLYVDYLNRAAVSIDRDLRKCPIALRNVPVHNLVVRLAGVQPNPKQRPDDVSRQLVTHLQRTFYVRVVGKVNKRYGNDASEREESFVELAEPENELPLVELYTEADCTTLVYQKLIDEKVFIRPSFGMSRKR